MKFQKLVMATSVCAALSGMSGVAGADVLGLPGEALLVTPVVSDPVTAGVETYVALRVPVTIGSDYIINTYTAPNTTAPGAVTVQTLNDPRIYWTLFNENSVKVEDGDCWVSPGDVVIWTTDPVVRGIEQVQRANRGLVGAAGRPDPVCGPTNPPRTGYVIFQTISGADGMDADFAFTADASIDLTGPVAGVNVGVPVVPMADARDPLPAGSGFPIAVPGVEMNEVITSNSGYNDGLAAVPVRYAPITAGIRFDNGNGVTESRVTQMPIVGPAALNGMAAHVYWFNLNQSPRISYVDLWDDMEGQCSIPVSVPRELNIWVYNMGAAQPAGTTPSWGNVPTWGAANVNNAMTDLIDLVDGGSYNSGLYCSPDYWDIFGAYPGALAGYAQNAILEYAYAGGPADGNVHTAGLQYALVQNLGTGLWTGHLATDIGIQ
jgi:hypothetical protein